MHLELDERPQWCCGRCGVGGGLNQAKKPKELNPGPCVAWGKNYGTGHIWVWWQPDDAPAPASEQSSTESTQ